METDRVQSFGGYENLPNTKSLFKQLIPLVKVLCPFLALDRPKKIVSFKKICAGIVSIIIIQILYYSVSKQINNSLFKYFSTRWTSREGSLCGSDLNYHSSQLASPAASLTKWPHQRLQCNVCPCSRHPAFAIFNVSQILKAVYGNNCLGWPRKIYKLQHTSFGFYARW